MPPADPTALAGALVELLARPDAARRMGQAAQAVALARFRPEVIAEQYLALYQEAGAAPMPPHVARSETGLSR